MIRRLAPWLLVSGALVLIGGCDWRQFALETELAPGIRDQLVRECCACLADGETPFGSGACGDEQTPASDGGSVGSPCLCGLPADACSDALIAGEVVALIGACTAEGGACFDACDGVLAYPP